jgi:hypothetical protein
VTGSPTALPKIVGAATELRITPHASGVLYGYSGLDTAVETPGCRAAGLYITVGDTVSAHLESNSQRVGYAQAIGVDRESSYQAASTAARQIKLEIE